jgi:SagB-type dehydrogenase family enzyme
MRIRSAQTLVFTREEGQIVAFNFLAKSSFACSHDLLAFLTMVDDWTELDEISDLVPATPKEELPSTIRSLLEVNALTEESSALAEAEEEYRASWRWGVPAALFHFSVQDKEYMTLEQSEALQRVTLAEHPQPPLHLTNDWAADRAVKLPPALDGNDLLQLMARRRTIRSAAPTGISVRQLSDCLFAGLGITGSTKNCVGSLPLAMTPSGGARHPYEAYVYVRSVSGLEPGIWHYSAIDHTLARLDTDDLPKPSELLGGQEWADEMPCIIILCALLERTMWKYDDANAYRVVMIEAGHVAQNLMLAATRHGLSVCPTAALHHSEIKRYVGSDNRFTHAPIYALTLAHPGECL